MTMTDERLAELDAVMAKATAGEWGADGVRDNRIVWSGPDTRVCFMAIYPKAHADSLAIVALHNAYPDLKALIDAQAATIAGLNAANEDLAALGMFASHDSRCNTKISVMADCTCGYAKARSDVVTTARAALNATGAA